MIRRVVTVVIVPGLLAAPCRAQAPAPPLPPRAGVAQSQASSEGTGRITGRVTNAETAAALENATVRLASSDGRVTKTAGTNASGMFEFDRLPAGRYTLNVSKAAYVPLAYGQRRPFESGTTIDLANGGQLEGLDIALPKGGVIVVRVTDEFGDPVPHVYVRAERYSYSQGERRLTPVNTERSMLAPATDDRGEVRVHGLPPGIYYVCATAPFGIESLGGAPGERSYVTTYYPGTPSPADAQTVTIGAGRETEITFPLVAARLARVSGRILTSSGDVSNGAPTLGYVLPGVSGYRGGGKPDGQFSFTALPPGEYFIQVAPYATAKPGDEYARVPVVVNGEDVSLTITTGKPGTFSGRFVYDGPAPPSRPATLQPTTVTERREPPMQNSGNVTWRPDGSFVMTGQFGQRLIRLRTPSDGWFLKAVKLGDRDITDTPIDFDTTRDVSGIEILVTQKQSEVSGTATDSKNAGVSEFVAVIFPEERQKWTPQSRFIAAAKADQQGRFKIAGLPPGRYWAAAVDYMETGAQRDPDLLERLRSAAIPIVIEETRPLTIVVKLAE